METAQWIRHFNPLSPSGERLTRNFEITIRIPISTHSPHPGRDTPFVDLNPYLNRFQPTLPIRGETLKWLLELLAKLLFQPTLPIRGETRLLAFAFAALLISTHSPHPGRDLLVPCNRIVYWSISIHSPLTGRDAFVRMPQLLRG